MESHISEIFSGNNRRHAHRRKARLPVSVSFIETNAPADSSHSPLLSVLGYTRDLSADGLALILPSVPPGEDDLTSEARHLRIILALPLGDVEMRSTVVRHERLGENDPEIGYLVGVSIDEMTAPESDLYLEYLRTLGG